MRLPALLTSAHKWIGVAIALLIGASAIALLLAASGFWLLFYRVRPFT